MAIRPFYLLPRARLSLTDADETGAPVPGYELRADQASAFAVIDDRLYPLVRLSPEGALLWTGDELGALRVGDMLTLSLEVDGVETPPVRARVTRRASGGREPLHVQFIQPSLRLASQIATLLEDLRRQRIATRPGFSPMPDPIGA